MKKQSKRFLVIEKWFIIVFFLFLKQVAVPLVRFLWIKKVIGIENIPKKGPVIIAFNHASYFDFIAFIAITPRQIHYLTAEKFYKSWFWRPIMETTKQIKTERKMKDKRVLHNRVFQLLKEGRVIGIFPEGTRSADGKLLPAFHGVAKYATTLNVPVVPVGIKGAYETMSRFDKYPRINKQIEFNIGKPIFLKQKKDVNLNKKAHYILTNEVMHEIARLSGQKYIHNKIKKKRHGPKLVVFDMDNTVLKGQSQSYFLKYALRKKIIPIKTYIKTLLWLLLYKVHIANNPRKVMEKAYRFLEGYTVSDINKYTDIFVREVLRKKIYKEAINLVKNHKNNGRTVVLISNAPDILVSRVASLLQIDDYICTQIAHENRVFTGKIKGDLMYGKRKNQALREFAIKNKLSLNQTVVYTDHYSDLPLLGIVKHRVVVNPDKILKKVAIKKKWKIYYFEKTGM